MGLRIKILDHGLNAGHGLNAVSSLISAVPLGKLLHFSKLPFPNISVEVAMTFKVGILTYFVG